MHLVFFQAGRNKLRHLFFSLLSNVAFFYAYSHFITLSDDTLYLVEGTTSIVRFFFFFFFSVLGHVFYRTVFYDNLLAYSEGGGGIHMDLNNLN